MNEKYVVNHFTVTRIASCLYDAPGTCRVGDGGVGVGSVETPLVD